MVPHKLRKTRKLRGSRTVGWGQVAQHRKHSQKGGRKVGRHKHLWSYVVKHEPDYFGRKGFTPRSSKIEVNCLNLGELDELVNNLTNAKQLEKKGDKIFIDLDKLGYQKLLARGKITKAVLVKVKKYSKKAAEKIEKAGGLTLSADEKENGIDVEKSDSRNTNEKIIDKS